MRKFIFFAVAAMMSLAAAAQTMYPVTVINPEKGGTLTLVTTEVAQNTDLTFTYKTDEGYILEMSNLYVVNTETGLRWYPGSMTLTNGIGAIYFDQDYAVTLMPKFRILPSNFTETTLKDGVIDLHWEKRKGATYELYVLTEDPNTTNGMPADAELIQLTDTFYTASFPKDKTTAYLYLRVCLSESEKSEWTPWSVSASGKAISIYMEDMVNDGWNGSSFAAVYPDGTERRICLDDYAENYASILIPWEEGIQFKTVKRGSWPEEVYLYIECLWDSKHYTIGVGEFDNTSSYPEGGVFWTYWSSATLPTNLKAYNSTLDPQEVTLTWTGGKAASWNVALSEEPISDMVLLDTLVEHRASDIDWQNEHKLWYDHKNTASATWYCHQDMHYYYYVQGDGGGTVRSDWVGDEFLAGGRLPQEENIPELHPEEHFTVFSMEDVYISAPTGSNIMSITSGKPYRIFKYTPEQDTTIVPYMPNGFTQWRMSPTAWNASDYSGYWSYSLTAGHTYYFIYISYDGYGPQSYGVRFLATDFPEHPLDINYLESGRLTNENTEARMCDGAAYTKTKYLGSFTTTEDSITIMYYDELSTLSYGLYYVHDGSEGWWGSGNKKKIFKEDKPYHFFIAQDAETDYAIRILRVYDTALPHATQDTIQVGDIVCDTKKEGMMEAVYEGGGYNFVDVFTHDFKVEEDTVLVVTASSPTLDSMQVQLMNMADSTIECQYKIKRNGAFLFSRKVKAGSYRLVVACKDEELEVGESICTRIEYRNSSTGMDPDLIGTLQLNEKKSGAILDHMNDYILGIFPARRYRIDLTDPVYVRFNVGSENQPPMDVWVCKDSLAANVYCKFLHSDQPNDFKKLGGTTYFAFLLPQYPYEIEGLGAWEFSLDTVDSYHLRPYSENIPLGKMVSGSLHAGEKVLYNMDGNTTFFPAQDYNVQVEKDKMYRVSFSFEASADAEFDYSTNPMFPRNWIYINYLTSKELKGGYDDFNGDMLDYQSLYFSDMKGKTSWYYTAPETGAMRLYVQPWLLKGSISYTLLFEELTDEQSEELITLNELIKRTSETKELPISASSMFLPKSTFVKGESGYFRSTGGKYHAAAYRTSLLVGEEVAITMKFVEYQGSAPWVEVYRVTGSDTVRMTGGFGTQIHDAEYRYYKESFMANANADYYIVCTTEFSEEYGDWSVAIAKGSLYNNPDIYEVPADELVELTASASTLSLHGSKKATLTDELAALTLKAGKFDLVNKAEYWSVDLVAGKASILYPGTLLPSGYVFAKDKDKAEVALSFYWNVKFVDDKDAEIATKQTADGTAAVAPTAPSKEDYDFKEWDKDFSHVTADMTVKAVYTLKTFTVKFVDWNDTELKKETVEWDKSATAPENPTREGYTFKEWDTDFSHVKSDLTVKAVYEVQTFTVKFVDWNDTELKKETVEYGKAATPPANPTRSGYTFKGWDTEDYKNVKKNLTVKAVYEANSQALDDVNADPTAVRKVLINGELFILRDGKMYTVQGAEVR